ncbi:hypothetical protein RJ639_032154 [Escallonia herrerae]|uniref:Carbonic anhydrase n=1 Tax=Escallonia herrerae TaxID=1293975 RepID=A0AA88X699_9ASTE|nr:hypothetical protein RJ639_032154 [Escallonia herrerae]
MLQHELNGAEDESEFDYDDRGPKGPSRWGELKEEWRACKTGEMQSPVDVSSRRMDVIPNSAGLTGNYKLSNATIVNKGHDVSLKWVGDAGSVRINGTDYDLQQCHWHSPSEHTVNGRRYDMELHMVHISRDPNVENRLAVIGLVFRIGQPDALLSKLSRGITSIAGTREEISVGVIDPGEIKIGGSRYYRYWGSLTVPPCTEGVLWIINEEV